MTVLIDRFRSGGVLRRVASQHVLFPLYFAREQGRVIRGERGAITRFGNARARVVGARCGYAGGGNPTIVIHLMRAIATLAPFLTRPDQCQALAAQADDAVEPARKVLTLEADRLTVLTCYQQTCAILGRPNNHVCTAHSTVVRTAKPYVIRQWLVSIELPHAAPSVA